MINNYVQVMLFKNQLHFLCFIVLVMIGQRTLLDVMIQLTGQTCVIFNSLKLEKTLRNQVGIMLKKIPL